MSCRELMQRLLGNHILQMVFDAKLCVCIKWGVFDDGNVTASTHLSVDVAIRSAPVNNPPIVLYRYWWSMSWLVCQDLVHSANHELGRTCLLEHVYCSNHGFAYCGSNDTKANVYFFHIMMKPRGKSDIDSISIDCTYDACEHGRKDILCVQYTLSRIRKNETAAIID